MTKFIVHIGDGKCGSTAIQNALYQSRNDLKQRGIYFDTLARNSGHTTLSLLAGQRSRAATGKREALAHDILKLLQDGSGDYDWVILSAENFVNLTPQSAAGLVASIGHPIEAIDVIAYVRNPPAMYASSIQQIIKGSHLFPPPESYHRRIDHKLQAWQAWIGADRMEVRVFDRRHLLGGDVVADFESYLSHVTGEAVCLSSETANRSLSAEQARVLQIFRSAVYPDSPNVILPKSTVLAQFFDRLNQIKLVGNPAELSDLARAVVLRRNGDVIDGLLAAFPGLPLDHASAPGSPMPTGPFPWADDTSIETVLAVSNKDIVARLTALVPDLNDGVLLTDAQIEDAMTGLGFDDEPGKQAFLAAYWTYLEARLRCRR